MPHGNTVSLSCRSGVDFEARRRPLLFAGAGALAMLGGRAQILLDAPLRGFCDAAVARSLVRAAEAFDGVTRQWLFDNPKTVVTERAGDAVRFQPLLLSTTTALHVQPRLCAPRRANEKGKVERAICLLSFARAAAIESSSSGPMQSLIRELYAGAACDRCRCQGFVAKATYRGGS